MVYEHRTKSDHSGLARARSLIVGAETSPAPTCVPMLDGPIKNVALKER